VRQSDGFIAVATHGNGVYSAHLTQIQTAVAQQTDRPKDFDLYPAFPNPFNESTRIRFVLPRAGSVKLEVFNILGEKVATLMNAYRQAGEHSVQWRATGVASGEYIVRMQFGDQVRTQKVTLQK